MGKRWMVAVGGIAAALMGSSSVSAAIAAEPLLVVVEAQPGSRLDAGEVRRRIAAELGQPVISPRDLAAAGASNVLIVALDATGIRVSLREGTTTRVSRVIPDAGKARPVCARSPGWPAIWRGIGGTAPAGLDGDEYRRAGKNPRSTGRNTARGEGRRHGTAAAAGDDVPRGDGSHCRRARRNPQRGRQRRGLGNHRRWRQDRRWLLFSHDLWRGSQGEL